MFSPKSLRTGILSAVLSVLMVVSVGGVANAAAWAGDYQYCNNHSVGRAETYARGSGYVQGPGVSQYRSKNFYFPGYVGYAFQNKFGQGGGSWNVYASQQISNAWGSCIKGNF